MNVLCLRNNTAKCWLLPAHCAETRPRQSFLAGTWLPACHPDGVTRFGPQCPIWKFQSCFPFVTSLICQMGLSHFGCQAHSCQGRAGLRAREAVHLCVRGPSSTVSPTESEGGSPEALMEAGCCLAPAEVNTQCPLGAPPGPSPPSCKAWASSILPSV